MQHLLVFLLEHLFSELFVAWSLSPNKYLGFFIPMSISITFIYRMVKNPNKNKDLEAVLKERNLKKMIYQIAPKSN